MNILLTSLQVPGAASGVRVHYERLATLLRAQGHRVTVVTLADAPPVPSRIIGALRHLLGMLPGHLGKRLGIELSEVAKIYFAIDQRESYDIVNAQDVSSGWAARLALRNQVPVVVTGHFNANPAEEVIRQQGITGLAALFLRRWYKAMFRRTRYFLGVSQSVLRNSELLLPANTPRQLVYNGLDFHSFSQAHADSGLRQRFPGQHIILNIGHLEARKNQRYLLEVAKELRLYRRDFVIGLVGRGPDEASLRAQIVADDLIEHVVLLGYHSNVAPLLLEADLYVHTALSESFGLVLIEAIAAGVPTLAFELDGTQEVLAATPEALLDLTTPAATLALHLHTLLDDAASRHRLHARQYEFATTHFSAAGLVANTLDFFEQARQHAAQVA